MFLAKRYDKKTGRTYLSIKEGFRNDKGIPTSRTIKTIGYLDSVHENFPDIVGDPLEYFEKMVVKMTQENNDAKCTTIEIKTSDSLNLNTNNKYTYGSIVLSSIYHELELHEFFTNKAKYRNFDFLPNKVMQLIIYSRILYPGSKLNTFAQKNRFFDIEHDKDHLIDLQHIYRTLDFVADLKPDLIKWLNKRISQKYERDTSIIFYDVTNYYYESDTLSELRQKGYSKENKKTPIIQMGLAVDNNGIPITYELFSGNTPDAKTYDTALLSIKDNYETDKIVIVADRGLNSGDNIAHTTIEGNGYIFGQSIKSLSKKDQEYVFNNDRYQIYKYDDDDIFKYKSRVVNRKIRVSSLETKNKREAELLQKQIVFYSSKYAKRCQKKREIAIEKALKIIMNPSLYDSQSDKGAFSYVLNYEIDDKTGELKAKKNTSLILDTAKIKEESKYDGYYMIVTSETKMADSKILDSYHGLWKIEETFKITKSDLNARPIYLHNEERIRAHFLMCYLSIVVLRILQWKTANKYSCSKLIDEIKNIECIYADKSNYLFSYRSTITDEFNEIFNLDIGKKWMSKNAINKSFSKLRK